MVCCPSKPINHCHWGWTDYAIEVPALKSDSKYLGLTKLSNLALEHELNSKQNNISFIEEYYSVLLTEIEKVRKIMKEYIDKYMN